MSQYTLEEFASLLTRTFAPGLSRDSRPRVTTDVTDKGVPVMEFLLPHPTEPRFSVSLQATEHKGLVGVCSLWFGQAEITGALDPADAVSAIEEIIEDNIVAIVRYKNRDAYDNRRKVNSAPSEWLYQLPDDQAELTRMLDRLQQPATLPQRLSGKHIGVFEVYRWGGSQLLSR